MNDADAQVKKAEQTQSAAQTAYNNAVNDRNQKSDTEAKAKAAANANASTNNQNNGNQLLVHRRCSTKRRLA